MLSLFVLQIVAANELQQDDTIEHINLAKILTLTFENPERFVTVTLSDKKGALQTPTTDRFDRQEYPKDGPILEEQSDKQIDSIHSQDTRTDNIQEHTRLEEGLPFIEFVGDDIEQIFYGSEPIAETEPVVELEPVIIAEEEAADTKSSTLDFIEDGKAFIIGKFSN